MSKTLHQISVVGIFIFVLSSMLSIGLGHTIRQLFESFRNINLVLRALLANFVVLPLVSLALAIGLQLDEPMTDGLMLLGMASGAPFNPKLTEVAGGNQDFAIAMMGLMSAGTVAFIPATLRLLIPNTTISVLTVVRPLLLLVLLPLTFGLVAKACWEPAATRLKPIFNRISNVTLFPLAILVSLSNTNNVLQVSGTGGVLAGLLLCVIGLVIGWLLGGPRADNRRALALSTGVRNFAVAIVVASQCFGDPRVEIMVIVSATVALLAVAHYLCCGAVRGPRVECGSH